MRKYIYITIINLILVLFQLAFFPEFFGNSLNPNLILCLGYSLLFLGDITLALYSVLIGGILLDMSSTGIIGLSALVLVILLLISELIRKTIFKGMSVQFLFVIVSSILYKVILIIPDVSLNLQIVLSGVLNFVICLVIYGFILKTKRVYLSSEFRIKA